MEHADARGISRKINPIGRRIQFVQEFAKRGRRVAQHLVSFLGVRGIHPDFVPPRCVAGLQRRHLFDYFIGFRISDKRVGHVMGGRFGVPRLRFGIAGKITRRDFRRFFQHAWLACALARLDISPVRGGGGHFAQGRLQGEGNRFVNILKRNVSARFERARMLVNITTAHTLRRDIFTSCPLRNAGVA